MFQFLSIGLGGDYVNNIIQQGAAERITDERFIELENSKVQSI